MTLVIKIENVATDKEEAAWWQHGTSNGVPVGRWVEWDGTVCWDDGQIWGVEQDAAALLNAIDGGDRIWDDGRHTEEIEACADQVKSAWADIPKPE